MSARIENLLLLLAVLLVGRVLCETDPGDYAVLDEFRKLLDNPEELGWPSDGSDPCGPPRWPHVFCSGARVSQIQVQGLGLAGSLPSSLNSLSALSNIGLQRNRFRGPLPSLRGLSDLQFAFLNDNQFDSLPADFLGGLSSLQVLSLDYNPLNLTAGGWSLPPDLADSAALANLTLSQSGLVGPIPDFLGAMPSLAVLQLSYNNLSGPLPATFAGLSGLRTLWLNNQRGAGLSGPLDVLPSMTMLADAWLHGNAFSGPIPASIGALSSLARLWLNSNRLVGPVPANLTSLPALQSLRLDDNLLSGPVPAVSYNFTYAGNPFCSSTPGARCSPQVAALLDFLGGVNYPDRLAESWSGDDPCSGNWIGVSCSGSKVSVINLPNFGLNGAISPSLGELDGLVDIKLGRNNLTGTIPANLTSLKSLVMLDVSSNKLNPPVPTFGSSVKLLVGGNPALTGSSPPSPSTGGSPPGNDNNSPNSPSNSPSSKGGGGGGGFAKSSKNFNVLLVVIPIVVGVILIISAVAFLVYRRRKGKKNATTPSSIVIHPRDPSDPDNMVKIVIANNMNNNRGSLSSDLRSGESSVSSNTHVIEAGNFIISLQVLRNATKNFAQENVLGRGGFGVVYKGMLHDGTMIAVKRMEASVLSNKALDEFQAEIAVLTKVRHRNLVSILGYSIEDTERLLVYEYMPQGALSKQLFQWKQLSLEPLSWKKRLNIALDVARGMEYLHTLAHQCFIHRDLKSSNILLGDDYRAKVSDFGLVKLAPDGKNSVVTRLAGTFGYLAPEYAVTGKITTKADVFSYGVVLMELITGLMALDESRAEETRYLASWFYNIKNSKEKLRAAIDLSLDVADETFESICIIAELAGHCTAREPHQRPDMGHAVNVLAPLVEKWKPIKDEQEEYLGIDFRQPLLQMVKGWQAGDSTTSDVSTVGLSLDDSKGSIPARPAGFAESFTSADGR